MFVVAGIFLPMGLIMLLVGWISDRRKRRRNTAHLEIMLPRDTFYTGETVEPQLRITNLGELKGDVRVGLVCTVFYDYKFETYTQHGRTESRQTSTASAYEMWTEAQRSQEPQTISFTIPAEAPYSHEGKAVSYALNGARGVRWPLLWGAVMDWGRYAPGRWITVYAHGGHAYIVVAGLRFDTSLRDPDAPGPSTGPRWSRTLRESDAFVARHPLGY
jgi:hypothetical protein